MPLPDSRESGPACQCITYPLSVNLRCPIEGHRVLAETYRERNEFEQQLRGAVDALREIKGEVEWFIANRSDVPLSAANSLLKIAGRALDAHGGGSRVDA